jgi:hypothetical protein
MMYQCGLLSSADQIQVVADQQMPVGTVTRPGSYQVVQPLDAASMYRCTSR